MPSTKNEQFFSLGDFTLVGSRYDLISDMIRFNTLQMIVQAQSGHIGASFSAVEMLATLYHAIMSKDDRFILSKGHAAAALYAVLASKGYISGEKLAGFRQLDGLQGHADVSVAGVDGNTGSLGMGISKGKGYAWVNPRSNVYVMVGDGELQEGQNWEAIMAAAHFKLDNLHLIIDRNEVQTDNRVSNVISLDPLAAKLRAFGWHVDEVDGWRPKQIIRCFQKLQFVKGMPKAVISNTMKGYGVRLFECRSIPYRWHSGIPDEKQCKEAHCELRDRLKFAFALHHIAIKVPEYHYPEPRLSAFSKTSLKAAFSESLMGMVKSNPDLVVLDADLSEDCGLREIERRYPSQFIECGIMEQDMVSTSGTLARAGRLPIVNTYAAFLTSRSNEQIYNNCSENDKVVYVGHLAGLLPGKPGKSHSGTRDISLLSSIPGLLLCAPSNEKEMKEMLPYLAKRNGPSYLRVEHVPSRFAVPIGDGRLDIGSGSVVVGGGKCDVALMTYGPLMAGECLLARRELELAGIKTRVITTPWLNVMNEKWLDSVLDDVGRVVCVENHSSTGGLSELLRRYIDADTIGVDGWTESGDNLDVLKRFGLDGDSIAKKVKGLVKE